MRKEELQRGNGSVCVSPSVIVINNDMLTDWSLQTQRKEGGSPPDCISHGPLYQRVHRWQMGRDTAPAGETLIRCDNISHTHTHTHVCSQVSKINLINHECVDRSESCSAWSVRLPLETSLAQKQREVKCAAEAALVSMQRKNKVSMHPAKIHQWLRKIHTGYIRLI